MRRLTGLFAVLMMALTVSPVMASSTSDSASNDYTATVNPDVEVTVAQPSDIFKSPNFDNGGWLAAEDNSLVDGSSTFNSGDAAVTVDPTSGTRAAIGGQKNLFVSSNKAWDLTVEASHDGSGNFTTTNGEAHALSNLYLGGSLPGRGSVSEADLDCTLGTPCQFPSTSPYSFSFITGEAKGEDVGVSVSYEFVTPDDLDPGTYETTLTWTVQPN